MSSTVPYVPCAINVSADLLTTIDAAKFIGVTPQHLAVMRTKKNGPPGPSGHKIGGQWFYRRSALERWIRLNK